MSGESHRDDFHLRVVIGLTSAIRVVTTISHDGGPRSCENVLQMVRPQGRTGRTKGGEALPELLRTKSPQPGVQRAREDYPPGHRKGSERVAGPAWHVRWIHSHCERLVYNQLAAKGFHLFLPETEVWSKRGGVRHRSRVPIFPGYLFLRHAIDAASHIEVRKVRGLVRILRDWSKVLTSRPGFGGPCLPKDTAALAQIVREHECRTRLVETVVEVNEQQKHRMVQKILGALHTSSNGDSLQKSP